MEVSFAFGRWEKAKACNEQHGKWDYVARSKSADMAELRRMAAGEGLRKALKGGGHVQGSVRISREESRDLSYPTGGEDKRRARDVSRERPAEREGGRSRRREEAEAVEHVQEKRPKGSWRWCKDVLWRHCKQWYKCQDSHMREEDIRQVVQHRDRRITEYVSVKCNPQAQAYDPSFQSE